MTKQCLRGNGVSGMTHFQSCEKERPVVGGLASGSESEEKPARKGGNKNAPGPPLRWRLVAAYGVLEGGPGNFWGQCMRLCCLPFLPSCCSLRCDGHHRFV